ncbi:MAG: 3-hydroxyacyl-CoA dehydrogenase family protein [Desulfatirhabdiaceae bacterium]
MKIGIIGFGKMGESIFKLFAPKSFSIQVVAETEAQASEAGHSWFKRMERSAKRGSISSEELAQKKESIRFSHQLEDLSSADVVIEAAFENLAVKTDIFQRLESIVRPDTFLTTNTSSLSIRQLADGLTHRDRFCGFHFFYPVPLINLIEVIRCDHTQQPVIDCLVQLAKTIDRHPIIVQDAPGSVINNILAYYYVEALYILQDGLALPSRIDEIARRFCYIGPCESIDVVGIDFFISALENAVTAGTNYPITWKKNNGRKYSQENVFPYPVLFDRLIENNRLGKKTGKGIYLYDRELQANDTMAFYSPEHPNGPLLSEEAIDQMITDRLIYAILNGSIFSLKQHMASMPDLNRGIQEILHMKKGPFSFIQDRGTEHIAQKFDQLSHEAGKRFYQSDLSCLKDMSCIR